MRLRPNPIWSAWLLSLLAGTVQAQEDADRAWIDAVYRESFAGELESAIADYERFAERHQDHPRAPEALLRSALCRERLGDLQGAMRLARRVKEEYPRSAAIVSRAETALQRLEGRAARERELETLVRENQDLRLQGAELTAKLDEALQQLKTGVRNEAELIGEVEALKERIRGLNVEKEKLEKKLAARRKEPAEGEDLSPEEILTRLEQEHRVREEEKRFIAEHFYRTGRRLQSEGKLREAADNYRQCLEWWDGHPKARESLLQVGSLLGDPESRQQEILRRLEIAKELRILEKKQELALTFRKAFTHYNRKAYPEAADLFRQALDILVRDLPAGPEFDRQKDQAARYLRICQEQRDDESEGHGAPAPGREWRLRVFALSARTLAGICEAQGLRFDPVGVPAPNLGSTRVPAEQTAELAKRLETTGDLLEDRRLLLLTGEPETVTVTGGRDKAETGGSLTLVFRPPPEPGTAATLAIEAVLPARPACVLPGDGEPVRVAETLSHRLETELRLNPNGGVLLAGLRNPFAKPEDAEDDGRTLLAILLEVIG